VQALDGHTIWPVEALIAKNGGKAPRSMTSFQSVVKRMGKPPQPVQAPEELPNIHRDCMDSVKEFLCHGTGDVPTLADLGLDEPEGTTPFKVFSASTCVISCAVAIPMYQRQC
jgi:hypothetical protein